MKECVTRYKKYYSVKKYIEDFTVFDLVCVGKAITVLTYDELLRVPWKMKE